MVSVIIILLAAIGLIGGLWSVLPGLLKIILIIVAVAAIINKLKG